jgi:hypothetical protein
MDFNMTAIYPVPDSPGGKKRQNSCEKKNGDPERSPPADS